MKPPWFAFGFVYIWLAILSATLLAQQPPGEDYSWDSAVIRIASGCTTFTWPLRTPGSQGPTEFHATAIRQACQTEQSPGPLTFTVRADGKVMAVNAAVTAPGDSKYISTWYQSAEVLNSDLRITVDGAARVILNPSILARLPNVGLDLPTLRAQVAHLASQFGFKPADIVVDFTLNQNGDIAWAGFADPNMQAERLVAYSQCVGQLWDLPYERKVMCGVRAAMVGLVPK